MVAGSDIGEGVVEEDPQGEEIIARVAALDIGKGTVNLTTKTIKAVLRATSRSGCQPGFATTSRGL
jgi:hypothetical protein